MISAENIQSSCLNGLVLAGGRSTRMGEDKALLQWYGKPQHYHLVDMLSPFCNEVFISCNAHQSSKIDKAYKHIEDEYENSGPLSAIISAFRQNKNCGWLVVACDLPLIDSPTIRHLIQSRLETAVATTYRSPYDALPEPLITIWEPAALSLLENAFSQGKRSPQKLLMNASIKMLDVPDPQKLMNANTPADTEKIRALITS